MHSTPNINHCLTLHRGLVRLKNRAQRKKQECNRKKIDLSHKIKYVVVIFYGLPPSAYDISGVARNVDVNVQMI